MERDDKTSIDKLIKEGFADTYQTFADLKIFKSKDYYILYEPKREIVYLKYEVFKWIFKKK